MTEKQKLFLELKEDILSGNDFLVNHAYEVAFKELDKLIYTICKKAEPNLETDFMLKEDMFQNAYIVIVERLKDYNGKYEPSTYFYPYILAAVRSQKRKKNEVSQHYQAEYSKILAAEETLKQYKRPASLVAKSILSGLSFEIIRNATAKMKSMDTRSVEEMSDSGFDVKSDKKYEQPYIAAIENERISLIHNIIKDNLSSLEQDVIAHVFFDNNDKYVLKTKLKKFSKEKNTSFKEVTKAYNSALTKFKTSEELQNFIGKSCDEAAKEKIDNKSISFAKQTKEEIEGQMVLADLFKIETPYKVKTEKIERPW